MSRGSPEGRRIARRRTQARHLERELAESEGRAPRSDEEIFKLAGIPLPRSSAERKPRLVREHETTSPDDEAKARRKARAIGLYSSPSAGLICGPEEPYGSLMPLWPGHNRRRQLPVSVSIRSDFLDQYGAEQYGRTRDHIRSARRNHHAAA
jgi:hypothetical protein